MLPKLFWVFSLIPGKQWSTLSLLSPTFFIGVVLYQSPRTAAVRKKQGLMLLLYACTRSTSDSQFTQETCTAGQPKCLGLPISNRGQRLRNRVRTQLTQRLFPSIFSVICSSGTPTLERASLCLIAGDGCFFHDYLITF